MRTPSTRRLAALAIAGGMAFIALAWIGATNPPFDDHLDTTVEYLSDAFLCAALVLTIPGLVALRRFQGAPRGAVETAVAGQLLLLIGVAAGLLLGEYPLWFAAVGVPGNLLWLVGTVRIGRHTWRARILPRWVAIAMALTVPVGIVLGEFGGSALPGLMWIYVGLRLFPSRVVAISIAARVGSTLVLAIALLGVIARPASAISSDLVISQVYAGGGQTGAAFTNDYVEIFNRSSTAQTLSGWSVQYAPAAGSSWAATPISGSIPAGGYFLVRGGSGGLNGFPLPAADAFGTTNMSLTAGKVALVSSFMPLAGVCPVGAPIVDFVGYGSASCFEGSGAAPAPAPGAAISDLRQTGGCTETDDNGADFTLTAASPRDSFSPANPCVAPVLDSIGDMSVDEGQTLSFTVSASDPDGDPLAYSASNLPSGASFDPGTQTFDWTPDFSQSGDFPNVHFEVSDGTAGDSEDVTITVNEVDNAPVLDSIGDKSVDEGQTLSFTVSASDPDGDPLAYSASNLPSGASFDPGAQTFSWTPDFSQSGDFPDVHFEVSDGTAGDSEDVMITVNEVDTAPVLDSIGDKSVDEGQTLSFTVSASDPDGDPLAYSASNLPSGASFDPGAQTFSWTPDFSQSGDFPDVHFEVSDGTLGDSEDVMITVNDVVIPPPVSTPTVGKPAPNPPSNVFYVGQVKLNKEKGTATLTVNVPGPGELVLSGKGLKGGETESRASKLEGRAARTVDGAGDVALAVRPTGRTKRKLNETGKATVKVTVTYTPTNGAPNSASKVVRLAKLKAGFK